MTETLIKISKCKVVENQFGKKLRIEFDYNPEWIKMIKALPWSETHRHWDGVGWVLDNDPHTAFLLSEISEELPEEFQELLGELRPTASAKIVIRGLEGQIFGNIKASVVKRINIRLSYETEEFQPRTQRKKKKQHQLFNTHNYVFPLGLLRVVKQELEQGGYEVKVEDNRNDGKLVFYKWQGPELRPYQLATVKQMVKLKTGTVCMPTGAGKTITALAALYVLKRSCLVLVHRQLLLSQWEKVVKKFLPNATVGVIGDGKFSEGHITIAMVQSLTNRTLTQKYDVLIVDEGHHTPADTVINICKRVKAYYRFALTATPFREDGKELLIFSQLGEIISVISIEDLVTQRYLAQPRFLIKTVDNTVGTNFSTYHEAYKAFIVENEFRNKIITELAKKEFNRGCRVYIDVKRVAHGENLVELFNKAGIRAIFMPGSTKTVTRNMIIKNFEIEHFVLISTLIREGVDLPAMNSIVLAGAGSSRVDMIQAIGRALRPKSNENFATIIELQDQLHYFKNQFRKRNRAMKKYYGELYQEAYV